MLKACAVAMCLLTASAAFAGGELALPSIISDHMVLQAEKPAPVWGWAPPGSTITVAFAEQRLTAKADSDGKWSVQFKGLKSGTAGKMTVSLGDKTLTIDDVLVGEVWLGGGQSNMNMRVIQCDTAQPAIAQANYPQIRMFTVDLATAACPAADCVGAWQVCSPKTVGTFSAAAYFFGLELHKALKQPVGLIHSAVGGTPIEWWLPGAKDAPKRSRPKPAAAPAKRPAGKPVAPVFRPTELYNGMIAPLASYGLRGFLWYQGESNCTQPKIYGGQLASLIPSWRRVWGDESAWFLIVQLPNIEAPQTHPVERSSWALLREGQFKALRVPRTGMAVTIDIGDARDIHPRNKQDVGRRLALWALAKVYGRQIAFSGPLYRSMKIDGDKIVLSFDHAQGLAAGGGGKLKGFAVAGQDRKFVWAQAAIQGDTVVVTGVPSPKAVRYAWAQNPQCNLVNEAGLPAAPFRTDDWED